MHAGAIIAVSDLARARAFYEDGLGLRGEETPGGWRLHADAGTVLYLLHGVSEVVSTGFPVASFRVDDARSTVRALRERGVGFLGADELPFTIDDDGVSEDTSGLQVAWMRDPDGSVLTVFSHAG